MAKVITVHVKLLEGEVFKPVQALSLRQGLYKILPTLDYDSKNETWEFPPGSVIRILEKPDGDKKIFIAQNRNSKS